MVIEEIQDHTQREESPVVTGKKFDELSSAYKKFKKSQGKGTKANLFLDGLMLGDLKSNSASREGREGVEFKITDQLSKLKSHNHNKGVTKGMPRREFLPDDSKGGKFGTFNKRIRDRINEITQRAKRASKNQN